VPEVVKVVKGVMSSEQAVALAAAELEAQGYRNVRHVGHYKHPDGVRYGRNTWVIQFDVSRKKEKRP
jgi:hypothetical protein